jgi:hypothetical protein
VGHLDAGADAAVDLGIGVEVDLTLAELRVVPGDLDEPLGEILHAQFGDRVTLPRHRQHALGLERYGADEGLHAAAGMGEHVAVVAAVDVDHFLPLDAVGAEEGEIDAERLLADLGEHVFMLTEFTVDPLPLDDGRGVVLDVFLDAAKPLLRQLECRLERMLRFGERYGRRRPDVPAGEPAVGEQTRPEVGGRLAVSRGCHEGDGEDHAHARCRKPSVPSHPGHRAPSMDKRGQE